ncbi:hypothetical protein EDC01DRAFT_644020 [Geopyxis carbonaria]|nr:hypothetical protein EDC01DRAFT_644020 [Geopyxis carbonaria]
MYPVTNPPLYTPRSSQQPEAYSSVRGNHGQGYESRNRTHGGYTSHDRRGNESQPIITHTPAPDTSARFIRLKPGAIDSKIYHWLKNIDNSAPIDDRDTTTVTASGGYTTYTDHNQRRNVESRAITTHNSAPDTSERCIRPTAKDSKICDWLETVDDSVTTTRTASRSHKSKPMRELGKNGHHDTRHRGHGGARSANSPTAPTASVYCPDLYRHPRSEQYY